MNKMGNNIFARLAKIDSEGEMKEEEDEWLTETDIQPVEAPSIGPPRGDAGATRSLATAVDAVEAPPTTPPAPPAPAATAVPTVLATPKTARVAETETGSATTGRPSKRRRLTTRTLPAPAHMTAAADEPATGTTAVGRHGQLQRR